jgi:hypothetical protein
VVPGGPRAPPADTNTSAPDKGHDAARTQSGAAANDAEAKFFVITQQPKAKSAMLRVVPNMEEGIVHIQIVISCPSEFPTRKCKESSVSRGTIFQYQLNCIPALTVHRQIEKAAGGIGMKCRSNMQQTRKASNIAQCKRQPTTPRGASTQAHTHIHAFTYTHAHTWTHTCTRAHVHTCTPHVQTHAHTSCKPTKSEPDAIRNAKRALLQHLQLPPEAFPPLLHGFLPTPLADRAARSVGGQPWRQSSIPHLLKDCGTLDCRHGLPSLLEPPNPRVHIGRFGHLSQYLRLAHQHAQASPMQLEGFGAPNSDPKSSDVLPTSQVVVVVVVVVVVISVQNRIPKALTASLRISNAHVHTCNLVLRQTQQSH